jgi:phage anti-repressor protein
MELIKISEREGQQIVSARELHAFLGNTDNPNTWFKRQAERAMLQDGEDFIAVLQESTGGRPTQDYAIKLPAAKELAMLNGSEKGKQARLYFIECERKAKQAYPQLSQHFIRWQKNKHKVPYTHFSMLGEVQDKVLNTLQAQGYDLINDCLPDGSLGLGFCKYLREKHGIDTDKLPMYRHEFADGRPPRDVKMYPNKYYGDLQEFANEVWIRGNGAKYFTEKVTKLLIA